MNNAQHFAVDVLEGLSSTPKTLPHGWIDYVRGNDFFSQLIKMDEYYIARAEKEIFEYRCDQMIANLGLDKLTSFDIIDLGAGDGQKTIVLLRKLASLGRTFDYIPNDISRNSLEMLERVVKKELPNICIRKEHGDFLRTLLHLRHTTHDWEKRHRVVLFLGNTIGNMSPEDAEEFIWQLSNILSTGDKLVLGVDLVKPPSIVLPAYSSPLYANFKLGILSMINDELGGNFDLNNFSYESTYTKEEGVLRGYIKSDVCQKVYIKTLDRAFELKRGEKFLVITSHKYDDPRMNKLTSNANMKLKIKLTDSREYVADYVYELQ